MKLRPHEFYNLELEDFFLMKQGYKKKIIDHKRDLRRMALIIVSPHVKDMPSAMRIWPIENDEELKDEVKQHNQLTVEQSNENFKKLVGMFKGNKN